MATDDIILSIFLPELFGKIQLIFFNLPEKAKKINSIILKRRLPASFFPLNLL